MRGRLAGLAIVAAAIPAACSPAGEAPHSASAALASSHTPAPSGIAPRAVRIAAALAQAEAAYETGATQRLGEILAGLQATGVQGREAANAEVVAAWSRAAGGDMQPFRGRLLGPAFVRGELAPGEAWKSAQTFKSGIASTLSVAHRGAGPVRMTVSDGRARKVCAIAPRGEPACRFTPRFTQRYDIELINEGSGRAVYFLVFD
jgi:hypothetical protein